MCEGCNTCTEGVRHAACQGKVTSLARSLHLHTTMSCLVSDKSSCPASAQCSTCITQCGHFILQVTSMPLPRRPAAGPAALFADRGSLTRHQRSASRDMPGVASCQSDAIDVFFSLFWFRAWRGWNRLQGFQSYIGVVPQSASLAVAHLHIRLSYLHSWNKPTARAPEGCFKAFNPQIRPGCSSSQTAAKDLSHPILEDCFRLKFAENSPHIIPTTQQHPLRGKPATACRNLPSDSPVQTSCF